jgi:hypothetical protein
MQQKKNRGINMKEDSLPHTINQITNDDLNVCFITAYEGDKPKEENEAANKNLERDLRRLGYGFTKTIGGFKYEDGSIGHEPGYKVAVREPDPTSFIEEMMALGNKYNQWSILLKTPGEKAKYIRTTGPVGDVDVEFNKVSHANPIDPKTFDAGYTQLQKDVKKNPTRAFKYEAGSDEDALLTLTEAEYNQLPEYTEKTGGRNIKGGNGWIVYHLTRKGLGLDIVEGKL